MEIEVSETRGRLRLELRDNVLEVVRDAEDRAGGIRRDLGILAAGMKALGKVLEDLPVDYVAAEELVELGPEFDVPGMLAQVCAFGERSHLLPALVDVVFRRKASKSHGRVVLGKGGATPKRDRDLGAAPFRITLALDAWLLRDEPERLRLLHHELGHCGWEVGAAGEKKPTTVAHAMEEFPDTVARYGLADRDQAQVVAEAMAHPDTLKVLRGYGFDPKTRQGLLFGLRAAG